MLTRTDRSASATKHSTAPGGWRSAWTTLPREARDTLLLLANLFWVVVLQAPHVPTWSVAITLSVLVWRGMGAWRSAPLPSRWWRFGLLAVALVATLATHRTLLGRDAGVTMILMLLALKTLELRAKRDAFVVFFLGLFTLLTQFFYSQSLLSALGILVAVWGLLTMLIMAHMPHGKPPLWQAARTAGTMALVGTPVMVALFLLFPRMAPLWGLPGDSMAGRTGLSNSMQVGRFAELALDESVALRIRFDGPPPPLATIYIRGPVLTSFDGSEWRPSRLRIPVTTQNPLDIRTVGQGSAYEVTLEPNFRPWVLMLDAPIIPPDNLGPGLAQTPDLLWVAEQPFAERTRYRAVSYTDFTYRWRHPDLQLQEALELPAGSNPRTQALARQWLQSTEGDPQAARRILATAISLLEKGGYTYTLAPGTFGIDSADEFWFDRKEGFCEHISAAFVILMRAARIPARVVTGYQGGTLNPVDGYFTVRQSDAHAWAEIWLDDVGWIRVDPTAAVAPDRTGQSTRLTPPRGTVGTLLATLNPDIVARLRNTWDAVNNGWNQWVLNYSRGTQMNLLGKLGFESPSWQELGYVLAALIALVSAVAGGWTWWSARLHDPWLRLLYTARDRARAAGWPVTASTTPRQLAHMASLRLPAEQSRLLFDWLHELEAVRYAPPTAQPSSTRLRALARSLHTLHWTATSSKPAPSA